MAQTFLEKIIARSPLSEHSIEIFTRGDCWALAKVLYSFGAGELVKLISHEEHGDEWGHIAIRRPNGDFLDAYGLLSEEDFRLLWDWVLYRSESRIVSIESLEEFHRLTAREKPFSSPLEIQEAATLLYRNFCS